MAVARDIDDLPKNAANYTALTPLWFLERAATVHPTRTSLVHGSKTYTWHQTYQRCRRLASALSKRSIGLGKTVCILTCMRIHLYVFVCLYYLKTFIYVRLFFLVIFMFRCFRIMLSSIRREIIEYT